MNNIGSLVVQSLDTCGGRPRIVGTRFSVQQVAVLHHQGLSAAEIVAEYSFLSLAQVYAALAYYYANQAEIDALLTEEAELYARLSGEQARAS